jgi:hypothetical protein
VVDGGGNMERIQESQNQGNQGGAFTATYNITLRILFLLDLGIWYTELAEIASSIILTAWPLQIRDTHLQIEYELQLCWICMDACILDSAGHSL